MVSIYISSTYSDLKECREKVYHRLRELRHDVIAMEDYVAADERPLDSCQADVARSDVYVGLFAWRYGYIPPHDNPESRSITELEYRKAVEAGKPCLIFLLEEQAAWSPRDMDQVSGEGDHGKRIIAFRNELKQERMISFFHSPDQLAGLVASAVTLWEKEHPLREALTTVDTLLQQLASLNQVLSGDAAQFAEEDVYPEQCNFISDDVRAASKIIQELLDVVTHLPLTAGTLRFQLSKGLFHAETLADELIQLIGAFRPICRSGSRQTTTKKNQIELKLQELVQSLENSHKTLGQLSNGTDQKPVAKPVLQAVQFVPPSVPISPPVVAPTLPPAPVYNPPALSDSLPKIGEIMLNKYDPDDFRVLCMYMGTDYDKLRPGNLQLKMLYLIEYCNRHNLHEKLIQQMLTDFPDLQGQL